MDRLQAAEIAVMTGVPIVLTYAVPEGMRLVPGVRVVVPLRKTEEVGVVVSVKDDAGESPGLKSVLKVLDVEPLIPRELLDLLLWTSRYYHAPPGATIALAFPPYLRLPRAAEFPDETRIFRTGTGKGIVGRKQHEILEAVPEGGLSPERFRELFPGCADSLRSLIRRGFLEKRGYVPEAVRIPVREPQVDYTAEQKAAIGEITQALAKGVFKTFLLHGITGSGKTEVYLACAMEALRRGRSVLYLVPEIALTPQTIAMIQRRIPCEIAVFHSGLPPASRAREFLKASRSSVGFVLGTRSAIFSPLTNLGLIVVDEEHDHSYKQEDGIPYNARDLSILRARNNGAAVVLGSATPSMDAYARAQAGHADRIVMSSRTGNAKLPDIEIVDMKGVDSPVSDGLFVAMRDTLAKGEQVLLFINRRGFSSALVCPGCGAAIKCVHCDRSLTYHRSKGVGLCHYCGYSHALPEICPKCGCLEMKRMGMGTEKILHTVSELFPDAGVLRMDSDEITTTKKLGEALDSIRNREVQIVVGTQMISKGHDFPHLTLVGVMQAEQLLFMPDFRAGERTFQQVVQVAGRAGRRAAGTKVIIQTLIPDHPLMGAIASYDYEGMIASEKEVRKATGFPPFTHMARVVFSSPDGELARKAATEAAARLKSRAVRVMGPAPAPVSLLRGTCRWHVILTAGERGPLHASLDRLEGLQTKGNVRMKIDVDPYTML